MPIGMLACWADEGARRERAPQSRASTPDPDMHHHMRWGHHIQRGGRRVRPPSRSRFSFCKPLTARLLSCDLTPESPIGSTLHFWIAYCCLAHSSGPLRGAGQRAATHPHRLHPNPSNLRKRGHGRESRLSPPPLGKLLSRVSGKIEARIWSGCHTLRCGGNGSRHTKNMLADRNDLMWHTL